MYAKPEAIRRWRERHGVSRRTLAQISGVPYKTLESWETGRRPVHPLLARYLELLDAQHGPDTVFQVK